MIWHETIEVGGKQIRLETGEIARQASGSVLARMGDTVVLVTAVMARSERDVDFLPMTVEYRERTAAAGRVPGGFFKREMRPADRETLTARIVDRSLRPLFPKKFRREIQVMATVLSFDPDGDPGVLAVSGASLALHISDIPWKGPVAGVRVVHADGRFVANPDYVDKEKADLDLMVSVGAGGGLVMVEGSCSEVPESMVVEALSFAQEAVQPMIAAMDKVREKVGKPKYVFVPPPPPDPDWAEKVRAAARPELMTILRGGLEKLAQQEALRALKEKMIEQFAGEGEDREEKADWIGEILEDLEARELREMLVNEGLRIDGRDPKKIRPISGAVGWLPRTHGSALFTRGETQAMVSCTLGTGSDEQIVEALDGEARERFLLHYNFPPYSVGEVRRIMGPGRREIGHGNLARRALEPVIPEHEEFPYTIRVVSDISESNGSSSMATVCGGTLAMMDAGVPIRAPVAGIAMGLVREGDKIIILSDILGTEDHLGDMDFKVAGTRKGITALQLDNKLGQLPAEVLTEALEQAREGRDHILNEMLKILETPRDSISPYAPRVHTVTIRKERIRDLIGPQGRVIQQIQGQTDTQIEVTDEGLVRVYASNKADAEAALDMIKYYTADLEKGKVYRGVVVSVKDFGAFVRIYSSIEGLVHISELDNYRVNKVTDLVKEGDEILVKVLDVDRQGKIRLSRKAALDAPASEIEG